MAHGRLLPTIRETLQMALTFFLVVIGWIIFRSEDMTSAIGYISRMFLTMFDSCSVGFGKVLLLGGTSLLIVEWLQRDKQHALQFAGIRLFQHRWVRWAIYYAMIVLIAQNVGSRQTFIYFQF